MTAKEFKAACERLGFGIAHARAYRGELKAFVAVPHPDYRDAAYLCWHAASPRLVTVWSAGERPGRDRYLATLKI